MTPILPALAVLALLVLPACSSGATDAAPDTTAASVDASAVASATPTPTGPPPCPDRPTALDWPAEVPTDLPKPPTAVRTSVEQKGDGLTLVMFTTQSSIRESLLFLVDALPAAGYTLGRGDAEASEADAPFVKGSLRGVMRMISIEPCRTDWLVAVAKGPVGQAPAGGNPLLPTRPSASPLPFG